MADAPYSGRFSMALLQPVLDAAAPIPADDMEIVDPATEQSARMPRAAVIIKRLENLDELTEMTRATADDLSPSELAKRLHAIEAAAAVLLKQLGVGEAPEPEPARQQVTRMLRWAAERDGERRGGFTHHRRLSWRHEGEEFFCYWGNAQLHDDIEAVERLHAWAAQGEALARARIGESKVPPEVAAIIDPWADDAVNDALAGILRIWQDVLSRPLSTSVDQDGIATGPLIHFALACLQCLRLVEGRGGKRLGAEAVRARIRRLLGEAEFQKTHDGHMRGGRPR